jgi:myo-inositol catabolism protein IolC
MSLGYDRRLYILAFDHRGSFESKLFRIKGEPSAEQAERIKDAKSVIAEGFERALKRGVAKGEGGILVDEQYGAEIARRAGEDGWTFAMPVEASGRDEFEFEFGDDFGEHIEDFDPTFSKVLVRYNPDDDPASKRRQQERLARLSDWLHERDRKFLFELLVPPSDRQLERAGGDPARYDAEVRPGLMRAAISELRSGGAEPDVWKIEGLDRRADCLRIAELVREGGRDQVGCVVLGRGADAFKVEHWLRQGAGVGGYLGFAIGRTIWWDALSGWLAGSLERDQAAEQIADNYLWAIQIYSEAATSA